MCNALLNVRFKRKIFHRNWPRLFEWWWTLSAGLISIQWIAQFVLWTHIRWIAIYSLDSFIYLFNNWALMFWSGSFRFYCHCQEGKYSEKLVMLKLLGILKELSKYLYTYLFVCLFVCLFSWVQINPAANFMDLTSTARWSWEFVKLAQDRANAPKVRVIRQNRHHRLNDFVNMYVWWH